MINKLIQNKFILSLTKYEIKFWFTLWLPKSQWYLEEKKLKRLLNYIKGKFFVFLRIPLVLLAEVCNKVYCRNVANLKKKSTFKTPTYPKNIDSFIQTYFWKIKISKIILVWKTVVNLLRERKKNETLLKFRLFSTKIWKFIFCEVYWDRCCNLKKITYTRKRLIVSPS